MPRLSEAARCEGSQIGDPLVWSLGNDYIYRDGTLLAADKPSGVRHYHSGHLGTPRLITSSTGAQVAFHTYYPFGEEATAFNQDAERMKFTGHERDLNGMGGAGDDLDYMHARFHSPVTGRLMSVDPAPVPTGFSLGLNRYSYVLGNPANLIDPDGRVADIVFSLFSFTSRFYFSGSVTVSANYDLLEVQSLGLDLSIAARARLLDAEEIRSLQEQPLPAGEFTGCSVFDSFGSCLLACAEDQLGFQTAAGAGLTVAGAPLIPKPFASPGTSSATSAASVVLRTLFPQKLPFQVRAPTLARPLSRTNSLGAALGRWVSVAGNALLAYDAFQVGGCVGGTFSPTRGQ